MLFERNQCILTLSKASKKMRTSTLHSGDGFKIIVQEAFSTFSGKPNVVGVFFKNIMLFEAATNRHGR
jgi:hypothetical protein